MNLREDRHTVFDGGSSEDRHLPNAVGFAGHRDACGELRFQAVGPTQVRGTAERVLDILVGVVLPPAGAVEANPREGLRLRVEQEFERVTPTVDALHDLPGADPCVFHRFLRDWVVHDNHIRVRAGDGAAYTDGHESGFGPMGSTSKSSLRSGPSCRLEVGRYDFGKEGSQEIIGFELAFYSGQEPIGSLLALVRYENGDIWVSTGELDSVTDCPA